MATMKAVNYKRPESFHHRKKVRREFEFKVEGVECSKCSRKIEGSLYLNRESLKCSGAYGFTVYTDGVICIYCQTN